MTDESQPLPILNFPALIIERILYFIDLQNLKRLRLTSMDVERLVDSSLSKKNMEVSIKDPRQIDRFINLVQSRDQETLTRWKNFHFIMPDKLLPQHMQMLLQWTNSFGAFTRIISVSGMSQSLPLMYPNAVGSIVNPLSHVLQNCTNLESVKIDEMDFSAISPKNWAIILKNLKQIRHLHIRRITFISDSSKTRFSEVLATVRELRSVTLPRIHAGQNSMSSVPIIGAHADESFNLYNASIIREYQKWILCPLLHRIKQDLAYWGSTTLKRIICPDELVTFKSYIQLAKLCVHADITLDQFFPSVIPSHMLHVLNEHCKISGCIGSLAGMNGNLLRQPFPKLRTLEITRSNFLFLTNGPYSEPEFPALETFRLNMSSWPDPDKDPDSIIRLSEFVHQMQKSKRPTVRTVYIKGLRTFRSWNMVWPRSTIPPLTVHPLLSFVNLTCLELDSVGYLPEEYLSLWENLKRLQKVKLTNCLGCNDAAIIGWDTPEPFYDAAMHILSLHDLTHLTLSKVGRITCNSYKRAFANMKLIQLHHEPRNKRTVDDSAFTALIEGSTWEFLESLQCSEIGFSNFQEKQQFFRRFAKKQLMARINSKLCRRISKTDAKQDRCLWY